MHFILLIESLEEDNVPLLLAETCKLLLAANSPPDMGNHLLVQITALRPWEPLQRQRVSERAEIREHQGDRGCESTCELCVGQHKTQNDCSKPEINSRHILPVHNHEVMLVAQIFLSCPFSAHIQVQVVPYS